MTILHATKNRASITDQFKFGSGSYHVQQYPADTELAAALWELAKCYVHREQNNLSRHYTMYENHGRIKVRFPITTGENANTRTAKMLENLTKFGFHHFREIPKNIEDNSHFTISMTITAKSIADVISRITDVTQLATEEYSPKLVTKFSQQAMINPAVPT